jgi:hypothetical protein
VDYGVAQEQNVQHRPRQEDAYQAIDGFGDDTKVRLLESSTCHDVALWFLTSILLSLQQAFFAVFDGDGGDEV